MSQLLDLSITLTPPPAGSPPEAIASIALRSDPQGLSHSGDLLTDPLTKQERNELRWYLEEYWTWPYMEFAERGKAIEGKLIEIGKRLYKMVFGSFGAMGILQAWRLQPGSERQISIISDIPGVLSLPWELLHDEQGFLALRTRHPVSIERRLPQRELAALPTPFEPPLRVLVVTARPEGTGFMDPRGVARELLDEVDDQVKEGKIAIEFLRPPTLPALRTRLKDTTKPVHILHFDGHGIFEGELPGAQDGLRKSGGEQGMLAFEDKDGKLDLVKADNFAQVLQDSDVKLAVLDACQSAMSSTDDAFSSVAARLIQGGVDAVIAMSASVLVATTTIYFEAFYRELAAGNSASIAQERARQALHDDPRRHLSRRRKDEEGAPVELRDWWLPHFYQQRPLVLQATRPSGPLPEQTVATLNRLETMPDEPRYGFTGRARELFLIERHLQRGKLVAIHGFGGNGKTALAREAADWLTRTRMYEGAIFVSFEHGGDSAVLLSALGTYLNVYDGNYNPNDNKAALARLQPALKQKRIMLIADNLESLLPGGEAPLDTVVRTQLWNTLLELSNMGAGVLLTTRDTSFGDGRLAPGKHVAHLPLSGLYPEDAYTLATRLLTDLDIDRSRAPYADLRDLLKQLDYHPLAIQLVLPALGELSFAQIQADFGKLLPRFKDDTETGRNKSLLASLEYSLRRLTQQQRELLPRLAIFEGGASEDDLLAITEIPKTEWAKLRPALEQAALLTAEQVHEVLKYPFLHFHPVLAPYLRSQPGADDPALRERYARRYYELSGYLYDEDNRNPQPVRALVRRELPNLRRALELLLDTGKLDDATNMADSIAKFLNNFGLGRERDELRKRVSEAVAEAIAQNDAVLTYAEYVRESGLGEDEFGRGDLRRAYARFSALLTRIEALPEGIALGRGSYEHCTTLHRVARCLKFGRQPVVAEKRLREALVIIEAHVRQQPDNQSYIRGQGVLLGELADVLQEQGQYAQSQEMYEEALKLDEQLGYLRGRGTDLAQLGLLALQQRDFTQAKARYTEALKIFRSLAEPSVEARVWHQLGIVAQKQKEWAEAERCYREGLALEERLGDVAGTAQTCNQLAIVAVSTNHPNEAEGWWKRALELDEQVQPGSALNANHLSNLARLLIDELRADRATSERLAEARNYAERALAIRETLDVSSQIWTTLSTLADIADLEEQAEEARAYRRRERETFAAFEGNRYHIDRQHGWLIVAIAAVANGNTQAQAAIEEALPELEEDGWHIADATRRIWAGERDWHSLVEGIDRNSALLVLRVLETIAQPESVRSAEVESRTPEEIIASLPDVIREALASGDEAAFNRAFEALSGDEQQRVMEALQFLQGQAGDDEEEEEGDSGVADALRQFESLLQAIAAAVSDASMRGEIEEVLDDAETKGWHLKEAVQRIWMGERDRAVLTAGLDGQDAALVRRVLELIGEQGNAGNGGT